MFKGRICTLAGCATALTLTFGVAPAQTNSSAQTIDLATTLRLAGARNLEVQLARARLEEAQANYRVAQEQFFPWLSVGVGFHRRDGVAQAVPAGTISDAHFQSYSPGANLTSQLAVGDALYNSLAARQLVVASNHGLEAERLNTILSAAQSYFELAKAQALVEADREAVATSSDYEHQLHSAVEAGIAFKGDEFRIQSQTQRYELDLRRALESQRQQSASLSRILHLDARTELLPVQNELAPLSIFSTNASLEALVEEALAARPDLKQSQAAVSAARAASKGAVYGPLVPTLGAQVFGGGLGGGPDSGPSNLGAEADYSAGLSWRVGPGGLFDSARTRAARARLTQSELNAAKLKDEVVSDVVAAFVRVQSLAGQLEITQRNLVTAGEALRLTRDRKQFGVGLVIEDIQAEQALTQARVDHITSLAEYNKAQYKLCQSLGRLPEAPAPARK